MTSLQASRTLVKSPPELWAELSDVGTLARHLGEFGEIRITKSHPEARVEWEADRASGTVRLEPTGWGTRVVLTVETPEEEREAPAAPEAVAEPDPEPEPAPLPPAAAAEPVRRGFWARLFRRPAEATVALEPEPVAAVEPEPAPEPPAERGPDRAYGTIEWQTPEPPAEEEPPPPAAVGPDEAHAVLTNVLDTLGAAHHRPYSRP
jgi:hypothetical protein